MLELPEAAVISKQLNETVTGMRITNVIAAQHPHKFAFYFGDPKDYYDLLINKKINRADSFGGLIEIDIDDTNIVFGDGVNIRYFIKDEKIPSKHQLLIELDNKAYLVGSVQMYGGLWVFKKGSNDNQYYRVAKEKISPVSDAFNIEYFTKLLNESSDKLSLKGFLATEQRIPGLGNGVLQDILLSAGLHPKKKKNTLTYDEINKLFISTKSVLGDMIYSGGRDTERDLFGNIGGYKTHYNKNTVGKPCTICGNIIKKEAYMGGSIYFCDKCQSL